jgi:nuclear pore complex protein Nup188
MPLYSPHIFLFHVALVSTPSRVERFVSEGVIAAYSNISIRAAISDGFSPAHCHMAGVVYALGNQHHFFSVDACGMIQLYEKQIARTLS